jgi:hypothetical protein
MESLQFKKMLMYACLNLKTINFFFKNKPQISREDQAIDQMKHPIFFQVI